MRIVIEVIPHQKQRYNTVGDWFFSDGVLNIRVSRIGNAHEEFLIGVHEYVEAMLCHFRGVTEKDVTDFDKRYEQGPYHEPFQPGDQRSEAGDSPSAPYHLEHGIATGVERVLAAFMECNWGIYEEHLRKLEY